MKTLIPENLKGKDLYRYLVANKNLLIATKRAAIKNTDSVVYDASIITPVRTEAEKAMGDGAEMPADQMPAGQTPGMRSVDVKVVANTAWFCDSQMDVLTDKCYDKSIKEKGNLIPHIADHVKCSTGHVGDVKKVYTQSMGLKELGYNAPGSTTALIFETTIKEEYNPLTYKFYKNGKINQHSIGLIYVTIGLCINDKESLPEYELWKKYYDRVINKECIDEKGYFWIVPEIKIMENSCVLFAANELTPTLESQDDTEGEPSKADTPAQPSKAPTTPVLDYEKIANHLFQI